MSEGLSPDVGERRPAGGMATFRLLVSWLWVGTPLAWGVLETVRKSLALFR